MASSDERREVARKLREKHLERTYRFEGQCVEDQRVQFLRDLNDCLPDGESAFLVLADLIDPTCHIAPDDWASEQCMGPMLSCDRCCAWLLPINGDYHYCPNCGARVTSGGER
jgi:hypothetical protein